MKIKSINPFDLLLIFVPLTILAQYLYYDSLVFFFACLAIVPLAGWMGKATEHLARHVGEGLGGLLNATFGNACELIIALAALRAGLFDIVKASITGSIIGNILLVLGASMLAGGMRYEVQTFNKTAATTLATLLALGAISLIVPATFHFSSRTHFNEDDLALGIAIVLFITYILSLVFSLRTHKHLYTRDVDEEAEEAIGIVRWSVKKSMVVLALATVLVAVLSELLVHHIEHVAETFGMTQIFIGVVLVAIVGNAAEHSTAVLMAMKNKMDLSINIALGSGAQIVLFVAPVLVFLSFFVAPRPMDLFFSPVEVLAVAVSVIILGFVATDGECNWLEGVQLLAVYAILGTAFFFATDFGNNFAKGKLPTEIPKLIPGDRSNSQAFKSSLAFVAQSQSKLDIILQSANGVLLIDREGKTKFANAEEDSIEPLQEALRLKAWSPIKENKKGPVIATLKLYDNDQVLATLEFADNLIYWDGPRPFALADHGEGLSNWLEQQGLAILKTDADGEP